MQLRRTSGGYFAPRVLFAALGCGWGLLPGSLAVPALAQADVLADTQLLRQSGCGGLEPAMVALRHVEQLDRTAALWASGQTLSAALVPSGYPAQKLAGLHVTGARDMVLQNLRQTRCAKLMDRELTDAGIYRRGQDAWLVLASARVLPVSTSSPAFAARVLELVNEARARGTQCGSRAFRPSGPLRSSSLLQHVAYDHALEMAQHEYFEHEDLAGRSPADRVRARGYREKLVGENIAYGPKSPEEVVQGWLDSPEHCENIMDPRFAETGMGYVLGRAPSHATGRGFYWVQLLAEPRI
jgi:uncharacterized protein YkwD